MDDGHILSLWDDAVPTPPYPTYTLKRDEDGGYERDADMRFVADVRENLIYRYGVLSRSNEDENYRSLQLKFCRSNLLYFINTFCYTHDPRLVQPHQPFVTYPFQDDLLTWCLWMVKHHETGVIEKSRDMGASWCIAGALAAYTVIFGRGITHYQMSMREDDVDNGREDSLMGKFRYIVNNLPTWMRQGWVENAYGVDRHMVSEIPGTGSLIRGHLTLGTSGRSGRATWVLNDEFAFVEKADTVMKSLTALSPTTFYLSTPNGAGNAFYVMAHMAGVKKKTLHWTLHPLKNHEWAVKEREKPTYTDERWAQEHEISYSESVQGRVYPEFQTFSPSETEWAHVQNGWFFEHDPVYDVYVFMDFGMADPTSVIFAQRKPAPRHFEGITKECLVIFDEYEEPNKTVDWWADFIKSKGYRIAEYVGDYRTGNQRDSMGETWIRYFERFGIHVSGRYNTEETPIMEVKRMLTRPGALAVNRDKCPRIIKAFQNWSYPVYIDEYGKAVVKPGSKPNHDQWSHCMKAMAYGVDWLYGRPRQKQDAKNMWDFRVFRSAVGL